VAPAALPRKSLATASVYESAGVSRRTLRWNAPTLSPNAGVLPNLTTLRDRSRNATRNDGYAAGVINKLVYNIVGTGLKPLSKAEDGTFRKAIHALWLRWTDESDADGLLDWYGQQQQAVRCWLEAGEVFLRLRPRLASDRLSVSMQVQVIEPELVPHDYNAFNGRNRIRAGIEFNPIGKRVAYYVYAQRPDSFSDFDRSDLRRVPADSVRHVYMPERAGQLRGVPHLTRALIRLRELDKFDDATLIRQQLSNMFVAFLQPSANESGSVNPLTGAEVTEKQGDRVVLALEPGIFQELQPGESVQFSEPPDIGNNYKDFVRQQLSAVSAATGVPYEVLTGDMTNVNDRTIRVILHEFRRQIMADQHHIVAFQLCRPTWNAWMDRVFLDGKVAIPPAYLEDSQPWQNVKWMPQGWPYIHPVQDVDAARSAIRAGFTSRSAQVSAQGEDAEVIDAEQAADNERADELELVYESDGRQTLNKGAAPASAPPTDPGNPPGETNPAKPSKPGEEPAEGEEEDTSEETY